MTCGGVGVALVCLPGMEPAVAAGRAHLDFIEIEPQVSWVPELGVDSVLGSGPVRAARGSGLGVLVHSVGTPVGGTLPPVGDQVALLAELAAEFECPWVSEHLSILRIPGDTGPVMTGVLLAPPQTRAGVEVAAANIGGLRRGVGVPIAFETGVNYLRPRPGELTDGEYFAAVAEAADCGILLDLHNLWCNEQNGRQPAAEVLAALPAHRVWEIHVAAGYWRQGHYLDAHSGPVEEPVLDLLRDVLPRLPALRVVTFEVSPDQFAAELTVEQVVAQLADLSTIVGDRPVPAMVDRPAHVTPRAGAEALAEVAQWERALGGMAVGQPVSGAVAEEIAADSGHRVWCDIALASRRGQVAGLLPLTVTLLRLTVGEADLSRALDALWERTTPAENAAEESARVAAHLRAHYHQVGLLNDVLDYELALHRCARRPDREHRITFGYDPIAVIGELGEGRLPDSPAPRSHVIVVPARIAH
jgi:uncharacterized protein (UPF0276 family)